MYWNCVAPAGENYFEVDALRGPTVVEFAIATHFVFETGFTNLQFVALSALAHDVGDRMFEKMVNSIQSDEARHAQITRHEGLRRRSHQKPRLLYVHRPQHRRRFRPAAAPGHAARRRPHRTTSERVAPARLPASGR